jgi:hypothetical protein
MKSKIDYWTKEELENVVQNSLTYSEVLKKIGYVNSGKTSENLKKRLEEDNIDTSHFKQKKQDSKRTEENVFVENSTACQSTLRRWYVKGNYTE